MIECSYCHKPHDEDDLSGGLCRLCLLRIEEMKSTPRLQYLDNPDYYDVLASGYFVEE